MTKFNKILTVVLLIFLFSGVAFAGTRFNGKNIIGNYLRLIEDTTPTAIDGYASVHTKSDNKLYFQDGAGTENEVALTETNFGEMYYFDNTVATEIEAVDQWHPAYALTEGELDGWTIDAGGSVDILSFADYSGTVAGTIKSTTDGAHSFATGDIVCLVGTNIADGGANDYEGQYEITVIDADEFYFTNANWNATTTAVAKKPDTLRADTGSAGSYIYNGSASASSVLGDKEYDWTLFKDTTRSEKVNARQYHKNANEYVTVVGTGVFEVSNGEKFWFAIRGNTDATNLVIRYSNATIYKP